MKNDSFTATCVACPNVGPAPLARSVLRLFACIVLCGSATETWAQAIADRVPLAATEDTMAEELVPGASTQDTSFSRSDALLAALTIFVLAIFVGFELITKVPPTLHTPLMSGSNAISGISLVGAILMAGGSGWTAFLGMLAVAMATINVVGGFVVTDRMLSMFRR